MDDRLSISAPDRPVRVAAPQRLLSDERLGRLVGTGDEQAFATIFSRYHQALYRYCRSLVLNDEDAQDALQATLAGALVALRRGRRDAPLRPWLYRIAHNEAISLLRARRATDELGETPAPQSLSPESRFAERERLATLVADLQALPDRQRSALVMRELSGLSHRDIALALGGSVAAAKQTIFEARRGLAEFADGRLMACEDVLRTISDGDGRALRGRGIRAHLRACDACAAFAQSIEARKAQLPAITPPLAPLAAAALITRLVGAGSPHAGAGAGVGAASVAAAGKTAGVALVAKTFAGVAILATAAAGASGVLAPAKQGAIAAHRSQPAALAPVAAGTAPHPIQSGLRSAGKGATFSRRTVRPAAAVPPPTPATQLEPPAIASARAPSLGGGPHANAIGLRGRRGQGARARGLRPQRPSLGPGPPHGRARFGPGPSRVPTRGPRPGLGRTPARPLPKLPPAITLRPKGKPGNR